MEGFMKHLLLLAVVLASMSGCAGMSSAGSSSNDNASTKTSAHKYTSCASLNKKYPRGVGTKGAKDETHGTRRPTTNYKVSSSVYKANKRLDRDDDGIACEHGTGKKSKDRKHTDKDRRW
jgi:uncharacterized protein YceK